MSESLAATYQDLCTAARSRVAEVSPSTFSELIDGGAALIDVREPDEWLDGVIPGARLVPRGTLEK